MNDSSVLFEENNHSYVPPLDRARNQDSLENSRYTPSVEDVNILSDRINDTLTRLQQQYTQSALRLLSYINFYLFLLFFYYLEHKNEVRSQCQRQLDNSINMIKELKSKEPEFNTSYWIEKYKTTISEIKIARLESVKRDQEHEKV